VKARRWLVLALFAVLCALRLPSLAQPAGGDQGLYAYVGQRILQGELPYRDAWDQKPPAIHYAYAAMQAVWPDLRVVAATDLLLTVLTAAGLLALGRAFGSRGGGATAALLFLALANPIFGRLGGVRVRGQCEVFVGALATFAVIAACRSVAARDRASPAWACLSGVAVGLAATFKYPAAVYGLPALVALATGEARRARGAAVGALFAGAALPAAVMLAVFAAGGALADLYHATFTYNLLYSGETYAGPWHFASYLLSFPVRYAWLDSLWWLGGLGTAVLLALSPRAPRYLVVPAWVAAACLAIAINGSRGLPQYFVQAWPALALAAGLMLAEAWQRISLVPRLVLVALVATGVWRVTTIPKAFDYWMHDVRYLSGRIARDAYLARFGERASGDKYSALAVDELAGYLRAHSAQPDRVLVFGFSPGALVEARRASATRFFWSRPVIVGFKRADAGYGVAGLLAELERHRPALVVLQRHDWDPDGPDSWTFFMDQPRLVEWLRRDYAPATELGNFVIWRRAS
jgi:MFS family permease